MKKKFLAALLAVCMVASMLLVPAMAADEGTFSDVDADAWYAGSIERWAKVGVLDGNPDGSFNPEGSMTRAQFAKVVVELLGLPTDSTEMPFEDVIGSADDWAKGHIAAAYNAGIIKGATDTKFAPSRALKFDDSAAMLSRALGLVDKDAYGDKVTEKLTELGMLDDNVNADAQANRALVAGLADKMIGKYVTKDTVDEVTEDGVITGEVQGVILVKGDVSVEIKDATVTAPIVVQGASVELTGKTTAAEIKVAGEKASVTAGAETKIEAIAVEGSDATVKVDGEVKSVTVAEDATVAEIAGEGVSKDNVTNNSAADVKVNDETVEGKPAETDPDPDEGQGESTGFVPEPVVPPANKETLEAGDTVEDKRTGTVPAASTGTDGGTKDPTEGHECDFSDPPEVTKKASCSEAGTAVYTCKGEKCTATKTVTIEKLPHEFTRKSFDATGHKTLCKYCTEEDPTAAGSHTGENSTLTYTNYGDKHTATCSCGYTKTEAHAQDADTPVWVNTDPSFHWKKCATCGAQYGQAVHTWGAWGDVAWENVPAGQKPAGATADTHQGQARACECGATQYQVIAKGGSGDGGDGSAHTHQYANTWVNTDATHHWHPCDAANCTLTPNGQGKPGAADSGNGYAEHNHSTVITATTGEGAPTNAKHFKKCECGHIDTTGEEHSVS